MLRIHCPYCQHRMRVKGAHAGRFRPACDRCHQPFTMVILPDPDAQPLIMPLPGHQAPENIKEESRAG